MRENTMNLRTIDELVELSGMTSGTLRMYCRDGKIKAIKRGTSWMISQPEFDKFLGVSSQESSYKREMYVKQLENENRELKLKLSMVHQNLEGTFKLINNY